MRFFTLLFLLVLAWPSPLDGQTRGTTLANTVEHLQKRKVELQQELQLVEDSLRTLMMAAADALDDTVFYATYMGSSDRTEWPVVGLDDVFHEELNWVIVGWNGERSYLPAKSAVLEDAASAFHFFKARQSPPRELLIAVLEADDPNSAGGVDVNFEFMNRDPERTIKYLDLTVTPYNEVGDVVRGRITGKTAARLRYTGPVEPGERVRWVGWSNVWYNSTISCIVPNRIEVEYMNGSRYVYIREIPSVITPAVQTWCPNS